MYIIDWNHESLFYNIESISMIYHCVYIHKLRQILKKNNPFLLDNINHMGSVLG